MRTAGASSTVALRVVRFGTVEAGIRLGRGEARQGRPLLLLLLLPRSGLSAVLAFLRLLRRP